MCSKVSSPARHTLEVRELWNGGDIVWWCPQFKPWPQTHPPWQFCPQSHFTWSHSVPDSCGRLFVFKWIVGIVTMFLIPWCGNCNYFHCNGSSFPPEPFLESQSIQICISLTFRQVTRTVLMSRSSVSILASAFADPSFDWRRGVGLRLTSTSFSHVCCTIMELFHTTTVYMIEKLRLPSGTDTSQSCVLGIYLTGTVGSLSKVAVLIIYHCPLF